MEINTIGSFLVDFFVAEAALGLGLLAIVIGAIGHALVDEHHRGGNLSHGRSRS